MGRIILHIDLDAFYASVEQRDHPEWQGKPLVVGWPSPRGVVAAASYEARRFGIHSAMPLAEAKNRCPAVLVTPPRIAWYAEVAHQIRQIFHRYTPLVEPLSLDEAYLDVTETQGQGMRGVDIARQIRQAIWSELRLTASAGIGPTKCVAKIASARCKPNGLLEVQEEQVLEFLHPLPVSALWGVGPVTAKRLERWGVQTIGQLARLEQADLVRRLGAQGVRFFHFARGIDPRPVTPVRERKSVSEEETFETDTANPATVEQVLHAQAEAIAQHLRRSKLAGRTITVKVKVNVSLGKGRYREVSRSHTLQEDTQSAEVLFQEACRLFRAVPWKGYKIRLVGLQISSLVPADREWQLALFHDRA